MAAAAAVIVAGLGVDPRLTIRGAVHGEKSLIWLTRAALQDLGCSLWVVLRIPTFQVLVLQVEAQSSDSNISYVLAIGFKDPKGPVAEALLFC
jgi:hypothetical protein